MKRTMHNLSVLLKIPVESLLDEMSVKNPMSAYLLVEDVKFEAVVKIASHYDKFPNIDWEDAPCVFTITAPCSRTWWDISAA